MAAAEMLMVFCYDVRDDKRRRRVARYFEDWAVRVQDSVFEARLTPVRAHAVFRRAEEMLSPADSLRLYAVPAVGLRHARAHGGAEPLASDDYYLF